MSSIEIHAPWLLRYVAVIGLLANRPLLVRTMEVMDRVEKLEDPILDFLKNMAEKLDFEAASKQLACFPDVFASDFFLNKMGEKTLMVGLWNELDGRRSTRRRCCFCWSCCSTCSAASRQRTSRRR